LVGVGGVVDAFDEGGVGVGHGEGLAVFEGFGVGYVFYFAVVFADDVGDGFEVGAGEFFAGVGLLRRSLWSSRGESQGPSIRRSDPLFSSGGVTPFFPWSDPLFSWGREGRRIRARLWGAGASGSLTRRGCGGDSSVAGAPSG
jgi:hypothetical protein